MICAVMELFLCSLMIFQGIAVLKSNIVLAVFSFIVALFLFIMFLYIAINEIKDNLR
jgi:hypothetical protein